MLTGLRISTFFTVTLEAASKTKVGAGASWENSTVPLAPCQVDPVLVRLGFVAACVLTAILPVLLIYLVGWIIVPLEPRPLADQRTSSPQPNAG